MQPNTSGKLPRFSWRKRLLFASITVFLMFAVMLSAALAADLYVHERAERYAGVNIWGYRGPSVHRKKPGEHRLIVLGGSTAFGYGVDWDKAFPAQLEASLRPLSKNAAPVSVVNLGFNAQGAYAFRFCLEDYLALNYDTAILYEGYNDTGDGPNEFVGRRDSAVFRAIGYFPVLHIALQEKAMAIRNGGDIDAAYRGRKTVFRPGLAARTTAGALEAAGAISRSLTEQIDRLAKTPAVTQDYASVHVEDLGCAAHWKHYCASMDHAIRFALDHHKKVLVVTQPYISDAHREQQRDLRRLLASRYAGNPDVGYADLGNQVALPNPEVAYDGMHLNPEGNGMVARALIEPVVRLMPDVFDAPARLAEPSR